ncbi:MAG TPA: flagellar hook-basal body complex protein, partial [Oligoflexia bacterium]|nr:flagellar hook-basal body complex protein [Oligoflexia bacterium]
MRDMTGLYAAREALSTHATALNTVADNLANLNTPGFKTERVEFGDLLAESIGCMMGSPLQTGNGSMARDISTAHSIQGTIEATDRELDAGIQGIGFFVLSDGVSQYYSRAGNFVTDAEGNLRAQSGEFVMGYTPQSPDTLVPLNLTTTASAATPTTLVTLNGNLDSSTPAQENPPNTSNWVDLNNGTAFRTTVQVVDSLGERHDISLHFFKTGNLTWTAQAFVDGAATGGTEDTPVPVSGTGTAITFNGQGLQADGA